MLMQEWNQLCQPAWSDRELVHKVKQAGKQSGERNFLRNAKPERWDSVKVPAYLSIAARAKPEPRKTSLALAAKEYIDTIRAGKSKLIELGIDELNYAIGGGVEAGEMIVMAARPSHGKSAVALQCVHYWTSQEMPCLIISEEMSSHALGKQALQYISDVPQEHWEHSLKELDGAVSEYMSNHAMATIVENCVTADAAVKRKSTRRSKRTRFRR